MRATPVPDSVPVVVSRLPYSFAGDGTGVREKHGLAELLDAKFVRSSRRLGVAP